jgi:hypothetical protein
MSRISSYRRVDRAVMDTTGPPRALKGSLSDVLFPVAAKTATLEVAVVFVAGALRAFFRSAQIVPRGNL